MGTRRNQMSVQLLQINYKFKGGRADFEREFGPVAVEIAKVPGLRWKVRLMNETESSGGGCYLFDDEASLRNDLGGPIVAALRSHPAFSELSVQTFAVLGGPTAVTRGPVEMVNGG
jgi:hypothetical protein